MEDHQKLRVTIEVPIKPYLKQFLNADLPALFIDENTGHFKEPVKEKHIKKYLDEYFDFRLFKEPIFERGIWNYKEILVIELGSKNTKYKSCYLNVHEFNSIIEDAFFKKIMMIMVLEIQLVYKKENVKYNRKDLLEIILLDWFNIEFKENIDLDTIYRYLNRYIKQAIKTKSEYYDWAKSLVCLT